MLTLTTLFFTSVVSLNSTQPVVDPTESLRAAMAIQQQQLHQQLRQDVRQQTQLAITSSITQVQLVLQQPDETPQLAQRAVEKAAVKMVAE
jgi:hypothetical protein